MLVSYPGANADIHVIPKIESADSIPNLQSIIAASDGVRPRWPCNPLIPKDVNSQKGKVLCNGIMNIYFWVVPMHDEYMNEAVLRNFVRSTRFLSPFLFFLERCFYVMHAGLCSTV